MVSQDLSFEYVSDIAEEIAFPESVVQYLRGKIIAPPRGLSKPLQYKVLKTHNLDPVGDTPGSELGEYKFEKNTKELRSTYGFYKISDKNILIDWKDF